MGRETIQIWRYAVLALVFVAGCGGSDKGAPAAGDLATCVTAFNKERAGDIGSHAYSEHDAREARVHRIGDDCAVVFVVPESDEEYGNVGEVQRGIEWIPLIDLGEERARAVQSDAAAGANAEVQNFGTIELR